MKFSKSKNFLTLFLALLGNVVEYYDFTIYGIFAISIGQAFFPNHSSESQILLSFFVFAIGFMSRPLGGLIFGYIGVKFNKKTSLVTSMVIMSLSTASMGFIPSYSEIGYTSSLILVVLRFIQGVCISGEGVNVAMYVLENTKLDLPKGFIVGLIHASNILGTLIAALTGLFLISNFRYGFIFGGCFSLIIGILRFYIFADVSILSSLQNNGIQKNKTTSTHEKEQRNVSLKELLTSTINKNFLIIIAVSGLAASIIYIGKSYINIIFTKKYGDIRSGIWYTFLISGLTAFFMPITGMLNDKFGYLKTLKFSTSTILILSIPIFYLFEANSFGLEFLGLFLFSIISSIAAVNSYMFCMSLYETHKFFSVSFGYNIGAAILGGTTPAISQYLISSTQIFYSPAFYLMFNCILIKILINDLKQKSL